MNHQAIMAHELCFVNDICAGNQEMLIGKQVRVTGKLNYYEPTSLRANIVHPVGRSTSFLVVNTEHLAPSSLIVGSLYQFLGELVEDSDSVVLRAKTVRNVDGLDVEKFVQAVNLQKEYLAKRFS